MVHCALIQAIKDSEPSSDLETRLANLDKYFMYFLYKMVCRSLFEKDKLLFSFLLCTRMMRASGKLAADDFRFLLTGGIAVTKPPPNPFEAWLAEKSWGEISRMSDLEHTKGFSKDFVKHESEWRAFFESAEPYKMDLPGEAAQYNHALGKGFERLLVIRSIRPDKLVPAVMIFVADSMGQPFIEPPPLIWRIVTLIPTRVRL